MSTEAMNAPINHARISAKEEGYVASAYAECPYISGQRVLSDWIDGFVAKCIESGITPPDTPPYVLGRIAYLQGIPCSQLPRGEVPAGRWMSGWLSERDKTPEQPNRRPGGTMLDEIFG